MKRAMKAMFAAAAVAIGLCTGDAHGQTASDSFGKVLINGIYYGDNPCWIVTLKAGSAGSLFGDTMGLVRTFRYETVVTVDGVEKLVIPGGTYSTNMSTSQYTVEIPLRNLGILEPGAGGTYYLTAFTRSYEGDSTVDIGYSLITEDTYVRVSFSAGIRLEASDGEVEDGILVTWQASGKVKDNKYELYRDGALIKTVNGTRYLDEGNPPVPDVKYHYHVKAMVEEGDSYVETESNKDEGMYGTKPELLSVKVAKLWLTGEGPYNVKLEWNDYNTEIYEIDNGVFDLTHEEDTAKKYEYTVSGIGGVCGEEIVDISKGGKPIAAGNHGPYTMNVKFHYTNTKSGVQKIGNEIDNVPVKVYFSKYDRDDGQIGNWFVYWKRDGAIPAEYFSDDKYVNPEPNIPSPTPYDNKFHFSDPADPYIAGQCDAPSRALTYWTGPDGWKLNLITGVDLRYLCTDHAAAIGAVFIPGLYQYSGPRIGMRERGVRNLANLLEHERRHGAIAKSLYSIGKYYLSKDGEENPRLKHEDWTALLRVLDQDSSFYRRVNGVCFDVEKLVLDFDGDGVSDADERNGTFGITTQSNDPDTKKFSSIPMRQCYSKNGDNEILARYAEQEAQITANTDVDWAFPGTKIDKEYEGHLKHMEPGFDTANMTEGQEYEEWSEDLKRRRKEVLWNDFGDGEEESEVRATSNVAVSTAKAVSVPRLARLSTAGESAGDDVRIASAGPGTASTGDGDLYASLEFPLHVENPSEYDGAFVVQGYLNDSEGRCVASAHVLIEVAAGSTANFSLSFDGSILYESRVGGFSLGTVTLEYAGTDMSRIVTTTNVNAATDRFYSSDEFARKAGYVFPKTVTEAMGDDGLRISVDVEINDANMLDLVAILETTNGEYVAEARTNGLSWVGVGKAQLLFPHEQLSYAKYLGPYRIALVQLFKGTEVVHGGRNVYTTKAYGRETFLPENPAITIDETSFRRIEANESAALYAFSVSSAVEGIPYRVKAFLVDEKGAFVTSSSTNLTFAAGDNEVRFSFAFEDFPADACGPFRIREIVFDPSGEEGMRDRFFPKPVWFVVEQPVPEVAFDTASVQIDEGEMATVSVSGGSEEAASSVKVYLTYGTATAADLDLGKTKYPITLKWAKGEVTNKVFKIKIKKDSVAEGCERFALQLANPSGVALGDARVCTVTIYDKTSSLTLAEGLNNGLISPSCTKSSKWTVVESSRSDTNETRAVYVQTPAVAAKKTTSLSSVVFKGSGYIHFSLKFIGNDKGKVKAALKLYDGKKLLGTVDSTANGSDWHNWRANVSSKGTHSFTFVFAQGATKSVRMRLADIWWEPDGDHETYLLDAMTFPSDAGYVSGQGFYAEGTKVTLKPRLRTGYEFDCWYDWYSGVFLDDGASLPVTVATNRFLIAVAKETPTVRGLPEMASGGTVAGGGVCTKGKRVTLTAKPAKYNTFIGWYASKANDANQIDEEAFLSKAISLAVDRTSKPVAPTAKLFVVTGLTESVTYYAKFKPYPKVTVAVDNKSGGTVKGAGSYLAGKTATLTATPKKGYAFCGWFDADGNLVSLNASYKYKVTADGLALSASFKKESALTKPELTWDATNLTVGVSYSAKLMVKGESVVSVTKVTGLPKGLTFKSGKVSGVPTVAKAVTAKVTVALKSNAKKTWTYSVKLNVSALPIWAVGTFKGKGTFDGKDADVTLTVGKTGKISGKFVDAKKKAYSFTAASFAEFDAEGVLRTAKGTLKYGTKTCKVEIAVAEGEAAVGVTGAVTASGALAMP